MGRNGHSADGAGCRRTLAPAKGRSDNEILRTVQDCRARPVDGGHFLRIPRLAFALARAPEVEQFRRRADRLLPHFAVVGIHLAYGQRTFRQPRRCAEQPQRLCAVLCRSCGDAIERRCQDSDWGGTRPAIRRLRVRGREARTLPPGSGYAVRYNSLARIRRRAKTPLATGGRHACGACGPPGRRIGRDGAAFGERRAQRMAAGRRVRRRLSGRHHVADGGAGPAAGVGDETARSHAQTANHLQGAGRGRKPRQVRVSRQYEPRNPHTDERGSRNDGPAARNRAGRRAAQIRRDDPGIRGSSAYRRERCPGFLEAGGRQVRHQQDRVRSGGDGRERRQPDGFEGTRERDRSIRFRRAGGARRLSGRPHAYPPDSAQSAE